MVAFASIALLAEMTVRRSSYPSFAEWVVLCLGSLGVALVLFGLLIFVGSCAVVFLSRRPAVIASALVFPLLPLGLGLLVAAKGVVAAFGWLTLSDELKTSELALVLAEVAVPIVAALSVTLPSVFVLGVGLFIRTLQSPQKP